MSVDKYPSIFSRLLRACFVLLFFIGGGGGGQAKLNCQTFYKSLGLETLIFAASFFLF